MEADDAFGPEICRHLGKKLENSTGQKYRIGGLNVNWPNVGKKLLKTFFTIGCQDRMPCEKPGKPMFRVKEIRVVSLCSLF